MTVIAFDTLAFANKLKGAGMNANLAEVQAEETAKILIDLTANKLATKQDISELKLATKQDISELKLATKQDIAEFKFATQQDLKNLELKMYSFMVKIATFTVGTLGGIQTLFHFVK